MPLYPSQSSSALLINDFKSYVDCGTSSTLSFGGNLPYTVSAWIKFSKFSTSSQYYTVISRYNYRNDGRPYKEYQLIINRDGTVSAWRGASDKDVILTSTAVITPHEWHHLAMSYDGQTLYLYIDGVLAVSKLASAPMPAALSATVNIGASVVSNEANATYQGLIGYVRIWNACLDLDQIVNSSVQIDVEDLSDPHQVGFFDFATIPAVDRSKIGSPIRFVANAAYTQDVPGVQLGAEGWADCGKNAILGFPGRAPFTIEGWFVPQSNNSYVISKFDLGNRAPSQYAIGIDSSGKLFARRGGAFAFSRFSLSALNYYHFAVTYNGSSLRLFINGNLQSVQADAAQLPDSSLSVFLGTIYGLSLSPDTPSDFATPPEREPSASLTSPCFIQNLRIWNASHSEDLIRQWMYNNPGVDEAELVASFDFTGAVPTDNTNLNEMKLYGLAAQGIKSLIVSPNSDDGRVGFIQPSVDQILSDVHPVFSGETPLPDVHVAPQITPLSEEHLKSLQKDFGEWKARPENVLAIGTLENVEIAFHKAKAMVAADPQLKVGVTRRIEKGALTLTYHGVSGKVDFYTAPEGQDTPCTLWWISFVYSLTAGFLGALGLIPTPGGAIGSRIWAFVSRNPAARSAFALLVGAPVTLAALIKVLNVLYNQGLLWPIIRMLLTSAGWYALFWVLRKVIAILTGLEAAAILAGFIVWSAQLIYLVTQYSGACGQSEKAPASPELSVTSAV